MSWDLNSLKSYAPWAVQEPAKPAAASSPFTKSTSSPTSTASPSGEEAKKDGPKIIYYIGILRMEPGKESVELVTYNDLSSFSRMFSSSAASAFTFTAKTVAERIPVGTRTKVEETKGDVHAYYTSAGFCAVMITESPYKKLAGQAVLSKVVDDFKTRFTPTEIKQKTPGTFNWPQLPGFAKEAINAEENGVAGVQAVLDETMIVLHKTIESVLERGEKLDLLVEKSDQLNTMSKTFYKTAKNQNSCCLVM